MIVGQGLIATAFKHSVFDAADLVVFASGVSNSTETRQENFDRETVLLDSYLTKDKPIIYFSTTSLFDPSKTDTPYIRHKLFLEERIMQRAAQHTIIRLPILIGRTDNPHTLINFLVKAIRGGQPITLHQNACRHLLDIDDLVTLVTRSMDPAKKAQIINILGSGSIRVPDLVGKIEHLLEKQGVFTWTDTGACYDIPQDAGPVIYVEQPDYVDHILKKYLVAS